jgi:hypothetical protein
LGRAFTGHHQFLFAHNVRPDRQDRRRYRPTSTSRSTRASVPFAWKRILDTSVLIAEDLGAAPTPLVLAQAEC